MKIRINKMGRRLFVQIAIVVAVVYVLSFLINTFFLPKYFLYEKKNTLSAITSQIKEFTADALQKEIERLENEYRVTIVYASYTGNNDDLNEALHALFAQKRLPLSKFWVTEETVASLQDGEYVNKLYMQEKLKSNVLVRFMMKERVVFAISESVAYSSDTIRIVNQFNTYIFLGALLLTVVVGGMFAKRMIDPLAQLKDTAEEISNLRFQKADIRTGDEIEELAQSINRMSDKLQRAHEELEARNRNLRTFISDISHELKTPLALIKAYTAGIKDGLDDGTFLTVIEKQTDGIAELVNKLLELSRYQTDQYSFTALSLHAVLEQTLEKYQLLIQQEAIELTIQKESDADDCVWADRDKLEMVLGNLLGNAVTYTTNGRIDISIRQTGDTVVFSIKNGVGRIDAAQLKQIWEPFYVIEQSRSKQLSGTGLGLSIVKAVLDKHQAHYDVQIEGEEIVFAFTLQGCSEAIRFAQAMD
ncbi:HAMP domain-containing histidine kinase [Brevibacillus sp. HB1.2]|uniref:sensor histidine kinase n=1 Tax=Brevibacillus sp. HB1.2 TaxID=2738807 RepID=UPI0015759B20|nr:HAMP domain-containing sensor histidine kinase [Brevibacillus sp. HB1.2]NTU21209.1 HAMP domain-containing histidine kinase [Brevibacillus sp. HB1.2]